MLLPPLKSFLIAAPLAWAGITAVLLAAPHAPKSAPAHAVVAAPFDARWHDVPNEPPLLKRQDRLAMPVPQAEPIEVAPDVVLPVVLPASVAETTAAKPKKKTARGGVCRKGKRWFRDRKGWKHWRCRR